MALTGGNVGFTGYQQPNYAGIAEASVLPMQAMSKAVGQVGDYFKKQGEDKKLIKQSDVQIDAALKLFPEMSSVLQPYKDQIRDENIPIGDRAFMASQTSDYINNALNMMKTQTSLDLARQREARMGVISDGGSYGGGGSSSGSGAAPSGTGWNSGGFSVQ
jgi:uncharacterized membrane protein YgcG